MLDKDLGIMSYLLVISGFSSSSGFIGISDDDRKII